MEKEITATTFAYEEIDPETRISLKQRAGRIGERTRRMATDIWENGRYRANPLSLLRRPNGSRPRST